MLICVNPPQAHAGVVVSIGGPVIRVRFTFVRIGMWRRCPMSPIGRILTFMGRRMFVPGWGYRPGFYENRHFAPRFEHREFVERRPYWRR